ncbi:hypothetical protein M434DRAFT_394706 [Hypoxylon sp. CO27-5]|nr:hypothetical protein M434DRAFT_394706 [Hypoxylon sp. CO27-5]
MIQYDIYVGLLRGNVGKPESNPADRLRESRKSHGLSCRLHLHKRNRRMGIFGFWYSIACMLLRNRFKWSQLGHSERTPSEFNQYVRLKSIAKVGGSYELRNIAMLSVICEATKQRFSV